MPAFCRWLGALLPMTYYIDVVRGIMLKGNELGQMWQQAAILTGFALLLVTVSVKRFSKTME